MAIAIDHAFVRRFARNIRKRTGADIRHTQILDDVADALGWRTDALMHALKTAGALADAGRPVAQGPSVGATVKPEGFERTASTRRADGDIREWMATNGIEFDPLAVDFATDDRRLAEAAFAGQLGRPWKGVAEASFHAKSVMAVLACRLRTDGGPVYEDRSTELARSLDLVHSGDVPHIEREAILRPMVEAVLSDEATVASIDAATAGHGRTATALMGMVDTIRSMGRTAACAEFAWLKDVDPNLWFAFESVGRRSCRIEAAGAFAHHREETTAGRPISVPKIDLAVEGLLRFLAEGAEADGTIVPGSDHRLRMPLTARAEMDAGELPASSPALPPREDVRRSGYGFDVTRRPPRISFEARP